jgi:hypothetical protein
MATENPRKKGIESFSTRKIFCPDTVVATAKSSRLTVSLEIEVEMRIIVAIVDVCIA